MFGNVVEDRSREGGWSAGGPSLYSARMAQALGARVTLVTSVHPGYDRSVFPGITLHAIPADSNPRYANTYDEHGHRTQQLLDEGQPLVVDPSALPAGADLCIAAPAYHEMAAYPHVEATIRGVSLQGTLRQREPDDRVARRERPFEAALPMVPPGAFAFLSEEDTADAHSLAGQLAREGAHVTVTHGYRGAVLFDARGATEFEAVPTRHVADPTGAGDCFATTFLVRYAETASIGEAMRYALAAGSLSVEGYGLAGIPARSAIEDRLAQVAA